MATTDYESVLEQARQLRPEEQLRLSEELAVPADAPSDGLGAQFVAYMESLPFDDDDQARVDAMKQAIEEGCERIDHGA